MFQHNALPSYVLTCALLNVVYQGTIRTYPALLRMGACIYLGPGNNGGWKSKGHHQVEGIYLCVHLSTHLRLAHPCASFTCTSCVVIMHLLAHARTHRYLHARIHIHKDMLSHAPARTHRIHTSAHAQSLHT